MNGTSTAKAFTSSEIILEGVKRIHRTLGRGLEAVAEWGLHH
jgi:hypothetical protein